MLRRLLGVFAVIVLAIGGWAWWQVARLDVEQVRPGLYMLSGIGGNVGVLATGEGVAVVDTMTLVYQGERIKQAIATFTNKPVVAILNTHYHPDHTHGNPAFTPGTKVVATGKTLQHLRDLDGSFWRDAPARDLLPNVTFDATHELKLGTKTLRAYHLGRGHTDGDLVVLFVEDRVLHAGDLFWNGNYPNIDLEAGGSVREWPATLDKVLALDFDTVIPGHGPVTDRAGLTRFRDFLTSLWTQTKQVVDRGGSLEGALGAGIVNLDQFGMRPLWWYPVVTRAFVIRRTYEEVSGRPAS